MLIKVVPVFEKMYGAMGVQLPGATLVIVNASRPCTNVKYKSTKVISIYTVYKYLMKTSLNFRRYMHRISLKYPLFGTLLAQSIYARIALVMSNLVAAGVSVISPSVIQGFVLAMLALIVIGTVVQMIHHKNVTYFFNNAKKAKLAAERELGVGEKTAVILKTVVHDIATTSELV